MRLLNILTISFIKDHLLHLVQTSVRDQCQEEGKGV